MQALKISSSAEQQQAEMMNRAARAQAKLQMSGDFTVAMMKGGAFLSLTPDSIAEFALQTAESVLTKFSLDNAIDKVADMPGVRQ